MDDDGIARFWAGLLGLPEWLPKAILRTAALILVGAVVVAPETARHAFQISIAYETERITHILGDLLDDPLVPPPSSPGQ